MEENLKIIQEIMSKGIQINNDVENKAQIRFEFYPSTKVFHIDIYVNGKCNNGLTKSWSVNTTDKESLEIVRKDLFELELPKSETQLDNDFLGD
jgi:hypothetical protein